MGRIYLRCTAAAFAVALTASPAGANLLNSCPDGVSVNMVIVDGVVDANAVVECLGDPPPPPPNPTPTPQPPPPGSTPTPPAPTPPGGSGGPGDCSNASICPEGCLTDSILGGYGASKLSVPNGAVRTFCAPVMPPYVEGALDQVKFQFYDESDRDCGFLVMSVEQTTGARMIQSTGAALPNANILFRSSWGPFQFPDRTEHGIYRITLTGRGGCNTTFRLGWGGS